MLRYRADIRTLVFVATFFVLVAVQYVYAPANLWIAVPLVVLTCWFSFFSAVITHNALHSPIFRSRGLNRAMQCVLTVAYGHPVSAFVSGHNLSHHRFTQTLRDVMRTTKLRYKWHLLNGLLFMPTVVRSIIPMDARFSRSMKMKSARWRAQLRLEWIVYFVFCAVLIALGWRKFLFYVMIPHQYAAWGIISMNMLQHDGCDETSQYNHSRNFVGKLINWFTFNNGFHTVHHMHPGLHWSLLPAAHAVRVAPFIHPNLERRSLPLYILRTFFWPGGRLRYDGTPLVLPPDGPDEDWIEPTLAKGVPREAFAET